MNQMNLRDGVPVVVGSIKGMLYGGPFRKYVPGTRRLIGVKMAAEIDHPHEVSVPTQDFSIPDATDMSRGLIAALMAMKGGSDVYVGCMGGIGRTGLFMGCMRKVMNDYQIKAMESVIPPCPSDPVKWVRANYIPHAIETAEQQRFVREFDTSEVLFWLDAALAPRTVTKEVEVIRYMTPVDYLLRLMGFKGN